MNEPTVNGPGDGRDGNYSDTGYAGNEHEMDGGYDSADAEELLEQAQGNAQAAIIATAGFLAERGVPVGEWVASLGRIFAKAWDEPEPWEAGDFLDAMLTNYRSLGADVVSADLGPDRAEAVTTGMPDPDLCDLFGVDVDVAAEFHGTATAIAAERGLVWLWRRDGDETRYLVTRASGAAGSTDLGNV